MGILKKKGSSRSPSPTTKFERKTLTDYDHFKNRSEKLSLTNINNLYNYNYQNHGTFAERGTESVTDSQGLLTSNDDDKTFIFTSQEDNNNFKTEKDKE